MRRCVIVAGSDIGNYEYIRSRLREDDYFIFCDCGLRHCEGLKRRPDLAVGDFDSYRRPEDGTEIIVLPREKDDTDTFFAAKEAMRRGFSEFLFLGVMGKRLDHTMGNISVLLMMDSLGCKACAIDDYSEMEIVSSSAQIGDEYRFFSVLNISGTAEDITIRNAKYPLENAEISCDYQYGISNEVIKGRTAEIMVGKGRVLLIKVFSE